MYINFFTERDKDWYFRFNDSSYYLVGWLHDATADGDTEDGKRIAPLMSYCGNIPNQEWQVGILIGAPIEEFDNKKGRKLIKKVVSEAMKAYKSYPVETLWDDLPYYYFHVDGQPEQPYWYDNYGEY